MEPESQVGESTWKEELHCHKSLWQCWGQNVNNFELLSFMTSILISKVLHGLKLSDVLAFYIFLWWLHGICVSIFLDNGEQRAQKNSHWWCLSRSQACFCRWVTARCMGQILENFISTHTLGLPFYDLYV